MLQRLFSTFADGWPGVGLLLLRLLTGAALIGFGIAGLISGPAPLPTTVLQIVGIVAGILLLVGLWTPVAGAVVAVIKLWTAFSRYSSHSGDPSIPVILAVVGAALAMLGPGEWSVDARLFGRKHIDFPER